MAKWGGGVDVHISNKRSQSQISSSGKYLCATGVPRWMSDSEIHISINQYGVMVIINSLVWTASCACLCGVRLMVITDGLTGPSTEYPVPYLGTRRLQKATLGINS